MDPLALRNSNLIQSDDYELEYLLHATFHMDTDENPDQFGYTSTAWTPVALLEDYDNPEQRLAKITANADAAEHAYRKAFGLPGQRPASTAQSATQSAEGREGADTETTQV